ncbi:RagB/SusD family nutrient uptake outer membrane protein [Mucilaginibacter rubeus]|uniref:RagB/SusD family nutrient uptake outer membrane protein n=1 Tax=Mucilaginibacter rubeus TaxID=2027860 RepID=UPI001AA0D7D7|nr:RagB/SusD family nutrient uptake outer membrane protein [Mucilaginibacter rubeus]QTE61030.1 RagB/SusD family nutrient uptake outer membrane protein [Mucilaginibacter rubeus]
MKINKLYVLIISLLSILNCGCKKDWLDAKPSKSLVVPTTVADYQALLDNSTSSMNINQPSLGVISEGDFYVNDTRFPGLSQTERSVYLWAPTTDNFYSAATVDDWTLSYARILNENVVLDGLSKIKAGNQSNPAYKNVEGSALFYRSFDYYNLAQLFCNSYSSNTAKTDLGLPLRTSANINITVNRSSVEQTYEQIKSDVLQAVQLLPIKPLTPMRPSKPAAYGLLSRIYLSQQIYDKALLYADSCLQLQNSLMDYNQLNSADPRPIQMFNPEIIFNSTLITYLSFLTTRLIIDPNLYQSYNGNDLRPANFFTTVGGNLTYKGSYSGSSTLFGGIATDEMYLNRAECFARTGKITEAMADLNKLLKLRWKTGTYQNASVTTADEALILILSERRKELCFRGLRWTDLRRLNVDSRSNNNNNN